MDRNHNYPKTALLPHGRFIAGLGDGCDRLTDEYTIEFLAVEYPTNWFGIVGQTC